MFKINIADIVTHFRLNKNISELERYLHYLYNDFLPT